jgi:ribonucleoside-diphosphate reductase alpha chain
MREINEGGGRIQGIAYIPPALKEVFVTALDISPEDHIRALATFQKWVDSSISKTINFPASATVDDMRKSYLLAYKLGCKDVTVFRDTSIKDQVLVAPKKKEEKSEVEYVKKEVEKPETLPLPKLEEKKSIYMSAKNRELKECPNCDTKLAYQESCVMCPECGWGLCV